MIGEARILVIYTGGTIGMVQDAKSSVLRPFDFTHLTAQIPELERLNCSIDTITLDTPVDSSNVNPVIWLGLARLIQEHYEHFDGFVVLHGSDTMAYTASALSFMLENLAKPVILTGSQLPIGVLRTDGKENFITAIEIAAARKLDGSPRVPEVCIYFEYKLYRGNRTHKYSSTHFDAFVSPNYPFLAEAGVDIRYNESAIQPIREQTLVLNTVMNAQVGILFLFPGIQRSVVQSLLANSDLKGVVLYTYGSGNAPTYPWFLEEIDSALRERKILLNVTQCRSGRVEQGRYETSKHLNETGVIGAVDMTLEAAVTKMMYLLGHNLLEDEIKHYLSVSLRGELTAAE